jgi:hypothetical protein
MRFVLFGEEVREKLELKSGYFDIFFFFFFVAREKTMNNSFFLILSLNL